MLLISSLLFSSLILGCHCKNWALLAAGSSGYGNYRHQADISHAYQLLTANGLPPENIIVMMYDDVANSKLNPYPGTLINEPDGEDVYEGVVVDYSGEDVNPENFLNILLGRKNKMKQIGSGRVVESGPDDYVFVNFADHGGTGLLAFPSDELYAKDLHEALVTMAKENRFRMLVLYVEACESGSMFDDILEDDLNIFVMTAADGNESSYGCYYDKKRRTYLGDVFSVNWMHEIEKEGNSNFSLHHVYEKVRTITLKSHVEEYGDLDIGNTIHPKVLGSPSEFKKRSLNPTMRRRITDPNVDSVPARDIPVALLGHKLLEADEKNDFDEIQALRNELRDISRNRKFVDDLFDKIAYKLAKEGEFGVEKLKNGLGKITRENMKCHKEAARAFSEHCLSIAQNPYVGSKLRVFVNACDAKVDHIPKIVRETCHNVYQPKAMIV